MQHFLLIDPALHQSFFRISYNNASLDKFHLTTSSTFWSDLNSLIHEANISLQEIHFFINFGPGSYTGLKQSKILAEVFSGSKCQVSVFQQDDILKIKSKKLKYFFSPAYKNQYYLAELMLDGSLEAKLINLPEWTEWYQINQNNYASMVTIDEKVSMNDGCNYLIDLYKDINYQELVLISKQYSGQSITYYRAVNDDYQISFSR